MRHETPNLQLLTDADVTGLRAWTEGLARMDDPGTSVWGWTCWQACVDEEHRRATGGDWASAWPSPGWLSTEALVLVGQLLSGLRLAGSEVLRVWTEVLGDQVIAELATRAEDFT